MEMQQCKKPKTLIGYLKDSKLEENGAGISANAQHCERFTLMQSGSKANHQDIQHQNRAQKDG